MLLFLYIIFSFRFQDIVQVEDKLVEEKEMTNTEAALSDDEEELDFEIGKFVSCTNITGSVK